MGEVLHYRGTASELVGTIRGFIGTLAGQGNVGASLINGVQLRVANSLLSEIEQAFIQKSRGEVGSDGIKWPPLKRETIAQRRIGPGDLAAIGIKGAGQPKSRVRGLLTKEQDKEWRRIFAQTLGWLMAKFGMGEAEAKGRAAQAAWAKLKAMGAKTKLEVLGGRQVDILRDTGKLLASFSPGLTPEEARQAAITGLWPDKPSGAEGQVLRTAPGRITVGTKEKPWHHKRRPFWPDYLPEPWARTMEKAAARGIQEAVTMIVRGAA